jgi:TolA-binding protein
MDRLIAEYPQSPYLTDAMYEKGRSYVLLENTPLAIQTFQLLWDRYPNSNNARKAGLHIGQLNFNANRPQQAAEAYKKVVANYPGSEEARVAIEDLKSVYFDLNDVSGYADYVRSLGGAVRFEVTEQDSLTYLAAERFFLRNEFGQARTQMQNYLQTYPTGAFNINARYYLAQTHYQDNNYTLAKQEFQRVLDAGNHQFTEETLIRLAELNYLDKEYEQALTLYERLQNTAANKTNQDVGSLGIILSASQVNRPNLVVTAANRLLGDGSLDPGRANEAKFYRAKAFRALGEAALAERDLQELSRDTRTVFGAEAKYLLAQYYFDTNQAPKAKETVQEYIQQSTPHAYWLARSLILMSDIFASEGNKLQARQYLESLQNNYPGSGDDIQSRINERINNL